MFVGKDGQELTILVEYMKGGLLKYALALCANIRLGWKGLPGTNTLAYYENS